MLWCHGAYNRGSGGSRRSHWATSDNPALAPRPGSRASRPRIAQWPSRAGRRRGQQHRRLWRKIRVVALAPGLRAARSICGCAGIARHIGRQHRPAPRLVEGRSSAQTLAGAVQPFKAMIGIAVLPKTDIRGWTPTSFERVLRPSAANRTIRARFKSRCNVTGERQHASSTLRSFRERWTSLASGIIHVLNNDSRSKKSGY